MRYHVLAADYDGTLAQEGVVDPATIVALERVRSSGRRLLLVTGRLLDDLLAIFPEIDLFERVVAENGAVVYRPDTREIEVIAEPPPPALVAALRARGVDPLATGRVVVATWQPHEQTVLAAIRELGLEWHVVFNKGAVMALPSGINKAAGLAAALAGLRLSPHNTVGVGDAENDHAFLAVCECAVAVANAISTLKERADVVTAGHHGAGVRELVDALVGSDLADLAVRRHALPLGVARGGGEVVVDPYPRPVLIAGPSGSGKSTLATALVERITERQYQLCVVDPEGDYGNLEPAVVLGDATRAPTVDEVLELLATPAQSTAVNLLGVRLEDRPAFFEALLPRLQEMRARTGRPHWILVDEAHHLFPARREPGVLTIPRDLRGVLLVTVHPEHVSPELLASVELVIGVGHAPDEVLRGFAAARRIPPPADGATALEPGEALAWFVDSADPPVPFAIHVPRAERRRHVRKYAAGELPPDRSFHFRGPEGKLRLRAQNLQMFLQLADGVDDETWLHHLRRGDYSRWFRDMIKDAELASETAAVERDAGSGAQASRAAIRDAVTRRYTAAP